MEYMGDKRMEGWIQRSREKLTPKTLNGSGVLKRSDTLLTIMPLLICAQRERGLKTKLLCRPSISYSRKRAEYLSERARAHTLKLKGDPSKGTAESIHYAGLSSKLLRSNGCGFINKKKQRKAKQSAGISEKQDVISVLPRWRISSSKSAQLGGMCPRDRRLLYISYQPLPFALGSHLEWSEIGVGGNEKTRRRRRRRTLSGRLRQSYYLLLKPSQMTQKTTLWKRP